MPRPRRTQRQPAHLTGFDLSGGVALEVEGVDDEPPEEVVQNERNVEAEVEEAANVEVVANVEVEFEEQAENVEVVANVEVEVEEEVVNVEVANVEVEVEEAENVEVVANAVEEVEEEEEPPGLIPDEDDEEDVEDDVPLVQLAGGDKVQVESQMFNKIKEGMQVVMLRRFKVKGVKWLDESLLLCRHLNCSQVER